MARINAKFIADKSQTPSALKLVQFNASSDISYTVGQTTDWPTDPVGVIEALNTIAARITVLEDYVLALEAIILE